MADNGTTHESFDHTESVQGSSDRAFGIVFTVFFALIGLWPLPWGGSPRWWALGIAAVFLLAALVCPKTLAPLNRAWMRFGLLLHKIVNPVIMGTGIEVLVVGNCFLGKRRARPRIGKRL